MHAYSAFDADSDTVRHFQSDSQEQAHNALSSWKENFVVNFFFMHCFDLQTDGWERGAELAFRFCSAAMLAGNSEIWLRARIKRCRLTRLSRFPISFSLLLVASRILALLPTAEMFLGNSCEE